MRHTHTSPPPPPRRLLHLYTALVRPHIDYANPVWNPIYKNNINVIENYQRRATKMIQEIRDLAYRERLENLNFPTLAYRRIGGDMIETFNTLNWYYTRMYVTSCVYTGM